MGNNLLPSFANQHRELSRGVTTAGVLIWNDVVNEGRQAFYQWHNAEHMPERMGIPGFVRGRRYASHGDSPQWFTLYEAASLDVLTSSAYLERLNNPTPATRETLHVFRNTARSVCLLQRAKGNAIGGVALVLRFDGVDEKNLSSAAYHKAVQILQAVEALTGVVSTSIYGADINASQIATAESKTRALDVPLLTLMVEVSHQEAGKQCMALIKKIDWAQSGLLLRQEHGLYGLEICFA